MNQIPVVTIPTQSHSSLDTFMTCPRMYKAKYITKEVQFKPTMASRWGDHAHHHLEMYIVGNGQYNIPTEINPQTGENMRDYQWVGDALLERAHRKGGKLLAERKFGVNHSKQPNNYFDKFGWLRGKIDVTLLYDNVAEVTDFKGLALDTKIPTPTGWTTMGDIQVGAVLFDRQGQVCQVTGKSRVKNLRCFELVFDDTSRVVCDEEHLWVLEDGSVVAVTDLKPKDKVPLAMPLDLPAVDLPIDPYVLGVWLADGKHTSGEITKPDEEIWVNIQARGYKISHDYSTKADTGKTRVHTIYGLRTQLRKLGLLGHKHIPDVYMRASAAQRLDLLRGIMDGDGSANHTRKQAVMSTVLPVFAAEVQELALALGQRAAIHPAKAFGFGVHTTVYFVAFSPIDINPFLLSRKAEKIEAIHAWGRVPPVDGRSKRGAKRFRRLVSVQQVPSVPTQCIAVDSPDNTFLCTERFIPTHNTGKKKNDPDQVVMYSASALIDYPQVEIAKGGYIWLKEPKATAIDKPMVFTRANLPDMWAPFDMKYARLRHAYENDQFPPKKSGLCGWCDVESCEFQYVSDKKAKSLAMEQGI